ncbi:putative bifunctional diguanylate cyclase/phosphodiesterase [Klenkia marina]|uniref:putative bifunctional diguanylate cyclase/phosphodiesterase n=1 Tax=Klenkia marina TaxID=1960309 RepID=UPI00105A97CE|nr:EAL domain-containing protein [Klenkia marina]
MLVLVPLSTVATFAVVLGSRAQAEASASASAAEQVRAFGQLARASAAVDQELLVVVVQAALNNPDAVGRLGITPAFAAVAADLVDQSRDRVRAETDLELQRSVELADPADTARTAQAAVRELRARVDGGGALDLPGLRQSWAAVAALLHAQQDTVVVAAASSAGSTATVAAIRDVRVVADLAARLNPDVVDYLGWLLDATGPDEPTRRWQWLRSHAAVMVAREAMASLADADLRTRALGLAGTPSAVQVDSLLTTATTQGPVVPTLTQLRSLVSAAGVVTEETTDVLGRAVEVAAASAAVDGAAADAERDRTVLVGLGAFVGTVLLLWLVGRQVTRSLRGLAEQADEIGRGRLVDVGAGGPREVRSVGLALGATVASLRRIQSQAGAVARGDLGAPVLAEPVPGPLGEVLHDSVERLVDAFRTRDRLQLALSHEAAHDPLTDLPNRAQALRLTTAALHRARRAGTATGLLFVDLDGFKGVNDRAGHAAGDAVLRTVASRMRRVARAGDTVCRLGGDEFVVLVEAVTDVAELVRLGERLVRTASRPVVVATTSGPRQVSVGASVGVALAQDGEVDGDELLARADAAVYRAKHAGRGRVEVFDDGLRAHIDERRDVEEGLRHGLAEGQLHVLYQPVLDVLTGALRGFGATPRWARPGLGELTPEAFVPVAEQSDLVCELDRWVLRTATAQLAAWRSEAGLALDEDGPTVSVDVSARFLGDPRVTDLVLEALVDAGLPARALVLEVGEAAVVEAPSLLGRLSDLRTLGVGIALDDFGIARTSIGALRHLPVDALKVAPSLLSADPADQRVVALVVAAAHASGLTVVAGGVEEAEVLDRLAADACDAAQGHHLSAPLAADGAGALFRAGTVRTVSPGTPTG